MPISRRKLLTSGATSAAAIALSPILPSLSDAPTVAAAPHHAPSLASLPSPELIALNRMGYGPRPNDLERVQAMGLATYVDQQLNPAAIDDSACDARITTAQLRMTYTADPQGRYAAVDELRPLATLNKQTSELWPLANFATTMNYQERQRPFAEVRVATWLRAVYSERQLQEVMVDFWHNHFNVNASSDATIAATFPVYDGLMRANCLGNFRAFLEEITKSTAMMYFLDNVSNRTGGLEGGNENYARELFELHTLGSENYYKFDKDRSEIGLNEDGVIRGYVDEDVYEAARCFTGWTIANGYWGRTPSPNTGEFLYDKVAHDGYAKIVLSTNGVPTIPSKQADLKDGKDVLDMLANHRGTARHICTKLCRRLVADNPPVSLVDTAVKVWMDNRGASDQIKQVVRAILLSDAFKTTWGQKVKRPFEAIVSYLRATGAELAPDSLADEGSHWGGLVWQFTQGGHRLFEWPTPTGHPDIASYWISTDGLLHRWNLPYIITQPWGGNVAIDLRGQTDMNTSCSAIVDFWIGRLCGFSIDSGVRDELIAIDSGVRDELIAFMAQGGDPNQPPKPLSGKPDWNDPNALTDRINGMIQLLATSPDFHAR